MSSLFVESTTCRLCGARAFEEVISFGETPFANNFLLPEEVGTEEPFAPLEVVRCVSCFSVQLRHTVDPRALFENYLYVSGTSPSFRKHFEDYAKQVLQKLELNSKDLVIDVGSNDGVLLKAFKDHGVDVLGIEPAKNIAADANAAGLETVNAFLTPALASSLAQKRHARVVTANNVFAHTDDLRGFAESVRTLLSDDGVFVFEVQYLKDLIEKNLFDIVYHEHIFYHHLAPLQHFFAGLDMEIFDVERIAVHGGSVRVWVQKKGGACQVSETLATLLQGEAHLNTSPIYEQFRASILANKAALSEVMNRIKMNGGRIAGYGAPAKATTFSYAFGLTHADIDFIVDDSPLKQGRVMPGTHIPIVARDELYARKPDYCLLLAWNFALPIMEATKRFAEGGGKYILPVPRPEIL